MKLVLALVFLFLTNTSLSPAEADVQCGNNKFCRVGARPFKTSQNRKDEHKLLRKIAKNLQALASVKIKGIRSEFGLSILVSWQHDLCLDDTVGFILDEDVSDYRVSCVWTGVSQFGQCRAVPPLYMNQPYNYIGKNEWTAKLNKVREAIGCWNSTLERVLMNEKYAVKSENSTTKTKNFTSSGMRGRHGARQNFVRTPQVSSEFYICNERCVQGGIAYTPCLLIITSLALSLYHNCVYIHH